jgi:hypothetical protein
VLAYILEYEALNILGASDMNNARTVPGLSRCREREPPVETGLALTQAIRVNAAKRRWAKARREH